MLHHNLVLRTSRKEPIGLSFGGTGDVEIRPFGPVFINVGLGPIPFVKVLKELAFGKDLRPVAAVKGVRIRPITFAKAADIRIIAERMVVVTHNESRISPATAGGLQSVGGALDLPVILPKVLDECYVENPRGEAHIRLGDRAPKIGQRPVVEHGHVRLTVPEVDLRCVIHDVRSRSHQKPVGAKNVDRPRCSHGPEVFSGNGFVAGWNPGNAPLRFGVLRKL